MTNQIINDTEGSAPLDVASPPTRVLVCRDAPFSYGNGKLRVVGTCHRIEGRTTRPIWLQEGLDKKFLGMGHVMSIHTAWELLPGWRRAPERNAWTFAQILEALQDA